MFAKYDMDGDRVLDEEEQKIMSRDLEDSTGQANLYMDGPPPSARSHFADFDGSSRPTTGRNDDGSRRQNHGGAGVSPEEYNMYVTSASFINFFFAIVPPIY